MKKPKFPREIFVKYHDVDDPFLEATKDLSLFDNGDSVAIYKLVEVKTVKVTEELI